jgi:hypothetical protein
MRYNQIPFENLANVPTLQMQIRSSPFVRVQNRKHIILDMPLRMTAGTFDDITRIGFMPLFSKSLTNNLTFFASY